MNVGRDVMNKNTDFAAHIKIIDDYTQVREPVIEHLKLTADKCERFAKCLEIGNYAKNTALLHDIGKYSKEFQKRINGSNISVDHSTSGMKEALNRKKLAAAFAIAGHHGGIPDIGTNADVSSDTTLIGRSKRDVADYSQWKSDQPDFDFSEKEISYSNHFEYCAIIRMLYSCLVDADFLSTEEFMSGSSVKRNNNCGLQELLDSYKKYTEHWNKAENKLNKVRNEIRYCCENIGYDSDEKLFSLTVPTGGGKTVASLGFALNHAVKHKKERVIYVIPYTSIIEQNAQVFRNILGDGNVLEHHCNVDYDNQNDEQMERAMLASENWDAPVIVTTAVQFFESLFSNKPSVCRKLHNIANSVVVFDEAQMLPVNFLYPCVASIWFLVNKCKTTAVLCTATQPSLEPFFARYSGCEDIVPKEICQSIKEDFDVFSRVMYKYEQKLTDEDLISEISKHHQVLCIVNKKSHAEELYNSLDNEDGSWFCLTTHICPEHRKRRLDEIRHRLKNNEPCRVFSTSLIEAGVDVDFHIVYRAIAGLDSIIQAGGRCNRENKRNKNESVVHIFDTEKNISMLSMNISATRDVLQEYGNDIEKEEAIKLYFDKLYYYLNLSKDGSAFDKNKIFEESNVLAFDKISKSLNLIDNNMYCIYIPTDENIEEISLLRNRKYSKELFRRLQKYIVNVYCYEFDRLNSVSAIEEVDKGIYVLADINRYNSNTGLCIPDQEAGIGIFL